MDSEKQFEIYLEMAKEVLEKVESEFGLNDSETYTKALEAMKGMDHGPNHTEDPFIHTQLVTTEMTRLAKAEGFSENDQRILQLAAVLHDIGKPATQKFDVISSEQQRTMGLDDAQKEAGQQLKLRLLSEVSGVELEKIQEIYTWSKKDIKVMEFQTEDEKGVVKKQIEDAKKEFNKLERDNLADLEKKFKEYKESHPDDPIVAANFRGHDKTSAEMVPTIIEEAKITLSEEEKKDLVFIIVEHMMMLRYDQITVDGFQKKFYVNDQPNERMIKMLMVHALADNNGTIGLNRASEMEMRNKMEIRINELKKGVEEKIRAKMEAGTLKTKEVAKSTLIPRENFGKLVAILNANNMSRILGLLKALDSQDKEGMEKIFADNPELSETVKIQIRSLVVS